MSEALFNEGKHQIYRTKRCSLRGLEGGRTHVAQSIVVAVGVSVIAVVLAWYVK
jgi:hypothetical protein